MLISTTYFSGKINIPGIDNTEVSGQVNALIAEHEPSLLTLLLGYELYKAFAAGISAGEPAQKWKDLRDGAEYTGADGQLKKWRGLITSVTFEDSTLRQSLIANYVWYWWARQYAATQTTATGEKTSKKTNAKPVSIAPKMARAWNECYQWSLELYDYLSVNTSAYSEWNYDFYDLGTVNEFNF